MIAKFSVKRPYTVVVGMVLVLVLGFVSFSKMKTDLLPDMTLPYALVYTTYIGASPEEVETTVTRPVEQSMATISNIENVTSVSRNLPRLQIWMRSRLKCGRVWIRLRGIGMTVWEARLL